MAPIYLAAHNSTTPLPSFVERGIGHLMPGPVDDIIYTVDSEGILSS
jgi:hypothetical protein